MSHLAPIRRLVEVEVALEVLHGLLHALLHGASWWQWYSLWHYCVHGLFAHHRHVNLLMRLPWWVELQLLLWRSHCWCWMVSSVLLLLLLQEARMSRRT